jgi:hypothetical protein
MTDVTRKTRVDIGPSATYNRHEEGHVAVIAQENTFVEDHDGIRRLVAKGSQIPQHLLPDAEGEQVDTRSLARPAVDEEASKALHERRDDVEEPKPFNGPQAAAESAAVTTQNAARKRSGGQRQQRSGGSES